jgi:hypothetical protein
MLPACNEPEQAIERLEQRQRQLVGQRVPDRISWPKRASGPEGSRPERREAVVSQPVGKRLEKCHPARESGLTCRIEQAIGMTRGRQPRLVHGRELVSGGASSVRCPAAPAVRSGSHVGQASKRRGASGSASGGDEPGGA